jgi:hypothetical protein
MGTRETGGLPARLENVRRRFERWREGREPGTRIPQKLWSAAVKAASLYGISRTATVLRVDYYSLKSHLEEESGSCAASEATPEVAFVELAAPAGIASGHCVLELQDAAGSKMRVELSGFEAPDLAALTRSFREDQP